MPELSGPRTSEIAAAYSTAPDLSELPVRVDRTGGATLVTKWFFPVSPRTLEAWPLRRRLVNGKAVVETAELFAVARARLEASPMVMGGRRAAAAAPTARNWRLA